jgi:hypothetical protein
VFFNCGCKDDDFVKAYTQIRSYPSRKYKHGYTLTVIVHPWWLEYMESARVALQSSSRGETVEGLKTMGYAFAAAHKCSACRPKVVSDFRQFVDKFAEEIENKIPEVCIIYLPFYFISHADDEPVCRFSYRSTSRLHCIC